jgi:hypothetical protein
MSRKNKLDAAEFGMLGSKAYEDAMIAVHDLLPSFAECQEALNRYNFSQDERIEPRLLAETDAVYAKLKHEDQYGMERISWFQVAKRSFRASNSSSWCWSLVRSPGCKMPSNYSPDTDTGQSDTYEEIGKAAIRKGVKNALSFIKTGSPAKAGRFGIVLLKINDSHHVNGQYPKDYYQKLTKFRQEVKGCHFNQREYQAETIRDDYAVLIVNAKPNEYDKYLLDSIRNLHAEVPLTVGFSEGDLYYYGHEDIFSDAIARLKVQVQNQPPGTIIMDGLDGARLADRIKVDIARPNPTLND